MGNAVAVLEHENSVAAPGLGGLMRPVAPPDEVLQLQEETRELIARTLKEGRDYGLVPGAKKNSLWKPGAERIAVAFGCFPRYRIVEGDADHDRPVTYSYKKWNNKHKGDRTFELKEGQSLGLYRYVIECQLVHRASNQVIGEGVGSCSTMESKYIDRPRDLENTVLKMASKRALVAAVLNTFGLSDQFTPEEEDDEPEANGESGAATSMAPAAGSGRPISPEIATFEQRERLAALVRGFGDGRGLTKQGRKNVEIARGLAANEEALASHVAEGIAMLEKMAPPVTAITPRDELPFA